MIINEGNTGKKNINSKKLINLPFARFLMINHATRPAFTTSRQSPARAMQKMTKLGSSAFSASSDGIGSGPVCVFFCFNLFFFTRNKLSEQTQGKHTRFAPPVVVVVGGVVVVDVFRNENMEVNKR